MNGNFNRAFSKLVTGNVLMIITCILTILIRRTNSSLLSFTGLSSAALGNSYVYIILLITIVLCAIPFSVIGSGLSKLKLNLSSFLSSLTFFAVIFSSFIVSYSSVAYRNAASRTDYDALVIANPFLKVSVYASFVMIGLILITQLLQYLQYIKLTDNKKFIISLLIEAFILLAGIGVLLMTVYSEKFTTSKSFILTYVLLIYVPISIIDIISANRLKKIYASEGFAYEYDDISNVFSKEYAISAIIYAAVFVLILFIYKGTSSLLESKNIFMFFVIYWGADTFIFVLATFLGYRFKFINVLALLVALPSISVAIGIFPMIGAVKGFAEIKHQKGGSSSYSNNSYSGSSHSNNSYSDSSSSYSQSNNAGANKSAKALCNFSGILNILLAILCIALGVIGGSAATTTTTSSTMKITMIILTIWCLLAAIFSFSFGKKGKYVAMIIGSFFNPAGLFCLIGGIVGLVSKNK